MADHFLPTREDDRLDDNPVTEVWRPKSEEEMKPPPIPTELPTELDRYKFALAVAMHKLKVTIVGANELLEDQFDDEELENWPDYEQQINSILEGKIPSWV